ncbi:MAG TPA: hypothetical protein VK957_13625, partial [Lunatimonas sp.]|nr:hypothetical protein [Lunatimonas sp.]
MKKFFLLLFIGLYTLHLSHSQTHHILSQREQAVVIDQWLEERIQTLLPELMDRSGIDMWVVISREYNEDPVIRTFLPATWHAARRRTMLLMYKPEGSEKVEALAVARYDVGISFAKAW